MFKSFFGCQYPRLLLPSKKHTPKLQDWHIFQASISIIQVNVVSWRKILFDEAMHGFNGKHRLKSIINFKKEEYGYLIYCIGDDGFIHTSPLWTTPEPKKWVDEEFYPTQARVIFLFEQLSCKFHICYLENLFMSTNICCTAYVDLKAKVEIHGVTGAKDSGLSRFVIQQEATYKLKK